MPRARSHRPEHGDGPSAIVVLVERDDLIDKGTVPLTPEAAHLDQPTRARFRLGTTALVALIVALAAAFPAPAATRIGTDPDTRVGFSLSGRVLTVTVPNDAKRVLLRLQGKRTFSCSRNQPGSLDTSRVAHRAAVWPRGKRSFTLRLPRDVSAGANFCLVEQSDGGDIAGARLHGA